MISLLGIYPRKIRIYFHTDYIGNVHNRFTHNSSKVDTGTFCSDSLHVVCVGMCPQLYSATPWTVAALT